MRDIPTPKRVIDIKKKRRVRRVRIFFIFLIFFIIIIGGSAYFSSHSNLTIDKVVVKGTSIIDPVEVALRVEDQLKGKYFYLYSKANSFIYPQKDIYSDLIDTFPRIKELMISRDNLDVLTINIIERSGSYLFCGSYIPESSSEVGENCYFVNNDGYIFDRAPYFSGNVYFKFYKKIKDGNNPLDQNVLEKNRFHEIARFVDGINILGFEAVSLLIDDDGTHNLYLDSDPLKTSPVIIFKEDNDLVNILNNLETAMKKDEFKNEINSKYDTLLYIDLRFKGKVLYKFQ